MHCYLRVVSGVQLLITTWEAVALHIRAVIGEQNNYLDDALNEYSRIVVWMFILHAVPLFELIVSKYLDALCRKCQKQWNRWFWKTAGKMNPRWPFKYRGHVVERRSSVDPRQLLWNAPSTPEGTVYRVDSAARAHFGTRATEEWEVLKQESKKEGEKEVGGGGGGGGRPRWHSSPSQRHFAECWPAAMPKPSVGSLSRGHVKQDVRWGFNLSRS